MPRHGSLFLDRADAGQAVASRLGHYAGRKDTIVLALPRGGVPVGFEVAHALAAPLDILVVRKLGVPFQPELAMGAIASGGAVVINHDVIDAYRIPLADLERATREEQEELKRRERMYRGARTFPDLTDRIVILVDDGLATGSSMRVAVNAVRAQKPAKVVVAVPVAAPDTCAALRQVADEVVCALTPEPFLAVGEWYRHFNQTSDDEVRTLLMRSANT